MRGSLASHTLNGMGLPGSSSMPAPSQPRHGSSPVISALSHPGSSSPEQTWLSNANRDGALSNGVPSGSLAEHVPVSAAPCANSAAAPHTSTGAAAVAPFPSAYHAPALRSHSSRDYLIGGPQKALSLSTLQSSQNLFEHIPRACHSSGRDTGAALGATSQPRTSLNTVAQGGDVVTSRDFRGGRQSITVLRVTCDGTGKEFARPPSSDSTVQAGSGENTLEAFGVRAQPPRMAIASRESSAAPRGSVSPRVHVESMAPIVQTVSTLSTVHNAMPQAVTPAELRQRPPQAQPQRASLPRPPRPSRATSTAPPNHWPQPRASPSASAPAAAKSTQPVPFHMPPSATTPSLTAPTPNDDSRSPLQPLRGASRSSRTPERPTAVVLAAANDDAALSHRPSRNSAVCEAGKPRLTGPATLQVSTTTLTTVIKKVRYLLPDEPFNPDAPDPSDMGGLTAEEETALLDPVNYTGAVHEVAGRYPMRLRRLSAQGGNLLHGVRRSAGDRLDDGAPRPTFLLDDGNRWVRMTNRPAVATTCDPCGTATGQLPAPPISQRSGVASKATAPDTNGKCFPAHQEVAAGAGTAQAHKEEEASGYLLQRHVQQTATGNRLVKGSVFQPPSVEKEYAERQRQKHDEDHLSVAAVAQPAIKKTDKSASTRPPQPQHQRRDAMADLYDEILRRTQQHRRSALPATVLPAAAPPQALPIPPPGTAARAAPPITECRDWRPHLSSAGQASLHGGHRGSPGAAPPPRSSSQPYIPITYRDETPSVSEVSSLDRYRTPLTYSAPQSQQQASMPLDGTGAAATDSAWPRLPSPIPHPRPGSRRQQRQVMPPNDSSSTTRGSSQHPGGERPIAPKLQLDSAPPRHPQQQQQQQASRCVTRYCGAAALLSDGSQMPKYTSDRVNDHNEAALAPPSPPAGDWGRFYRRSNGSQHNSVPGSHGPHPPHPPAGKQPSRWMTEYASSTNVVPTQPANSRVPRPQQCGKPHSSSYGDSADAREEEEEGYNTATLRPYCPDGETVLDSTSANNTVTDIARMHTTRRHSSADHIGAVLAPNGAMPTLSARSAAEKARRPQLHQHSRSTQVQEAMQTSNGNGSSLQRQGQARPHRETRSDHRTQGSAPPPYHPLPAASAVVSSSTRQRAVEGATVHSRNGSVNAGHAAALRLPAPAASLAAQAECVEARASTGSCDTDTQPVTVSERSENELIDDEDDALFKKRPPLLVLGDEVFAPEGYEYVEEGAEGDREGMHHLGAHLELERKHRAQE